ncbi:hypothetical protein EVAR_71127_1 [Eumeta japonica]|uniref:Uncharacterized protein n=1 Tax=Eumeta variegata TaxID=151549 RepID=A0A4C1ZK40_EUMVA|nr:hypothetical protein EVAR_71127_1 [Eumeta japonica]
MAWCGDTFGTGDNSAVRWRRVQKGDIHGMYTGPHNRSNLLEPHSELLTSRTRRPWRIRSGVCERCGSHALRTVDFVDCDGCQPGISSHVRLGSRTCERGETNSRVLTRNLKYDNPVVHVIDEHINLVDEIRFLGLTIDKVLTNSPYIAKDCNKATNIYKGTHVVLSD